MQPAIRLKVPIKVLRLAVLHTGFMDHLLAIRSVRLLARWVALVCCTGFIVLPSVL
jgi:hypothetical protein